MSLQEVSEAQANETVREIYEDVKATLCVTYVPSLFRVLASHEAFFRQMWASLEPTLTIYFVRAADDLRASAVDLAQSLDGQLGLPDDQREALEEALWVIHFAAPKTLLAATSLEAALSDGTTGAASRVVWPQNKGVPRGMPQPKFINAEEAESGVYADIRDTFQLPTLTDEWRALGPSSAALQRAWDQVRGLSGSDAYPQAVDQLTATARERGRALPRRVLDLDPETLRAKGVDDESQRAIRETVTSFMTALARETIHTSLWLSRFASPDDAKLTGLQLIRRWTVPHGYRTDTVLA